MQSKTGTLQSYDFVALGAKTNSKNSALYARASELNRFTCQPCTEKQSVHDPGNHWHGERVSNHAAHLPLRNTWWNGESVDRDTLQSEILCHIQFPLFAEHPIAVAFTPALGQTRAISFTDIVSMP